jgi:hypothetical protein
MFRIFKNTTQPPNAIESLYQAIPSAVLEPQVDNEFWRDIVASAGSGPVENGIFKAVQELRSMPAPIKILPVK